MQDSTPKQKKGWTFALAGMTFICGLLCSGVLTVVGVSHDQETTLFHSESPPNLTDDGQGRYVLDIHPGPARALCLGCEASVDMTISLKGNGGDGHSVAMDITGGNEPKSAVWTQDGVEVEFKPGHRLFVPAKSFTGDR